MKKIFPALTIALLLVTIQGIPAVFNVTNVAEFQSALSTAATNGENDTIHVAAGTYPVTSTLTYSTDEQYSLTIVGAGAASTILNGNDAVQILHLNSTGDNGHLLVCSLAFRHGNSSSNGGGAQLNTGTGSATVRYCEFSYNRTAEIGGGLCMTSFTGTLGVDQCEFNYNECMNNDAGGLFMGVNEGTMYLEESTFTGNEVHGDDAGGCMLYSDNTGHAILHGNQFTSNAAADGAGGSMVYLLGPNSTIVEYNNTYQDNTALLDGAGSWNRMPASGTIEFYNNLMYHNHANEAGGGGCRIQIQEGAIDLYNNTFHENISGTPFSVEGSGGGLWIDLSDGTANVHHNRFTANDAYQNGGGAQITVYSGALNFYRNVLNINEAGNVGGGFSFSTMDANLGEFHNTYYQNAASSGGGGGYYYFDGAAATDVYNCIFWYNTPNAIDFSGASTVTLRYSDVSSGAGNPWFGTGCIDGDPLFQDPLNNNFLLTWANYPVNDATKSPCIDSGDPASPHDPDNSIADMGAFYWGQNLGIADKEQALLRVIVYPSPVSGAATFRVDLKNSSDVTIDLYNSRGMQVATVFKGRLNSGENHIAWHPGSFPAGIYFCRVTTDGSLSSAHCSFLIAH